MKLVVGCPVRDRVWILPEWFRRVEMACAAAGVVPEYAFVVPPRDPSWKHIENWCLANGRNVRLLSSAEGDDPYLRGWNPSRYREMVLLRNWLLIAVRDMAPDFFLSLDSDILLHEGAVVNLLESVRHYDAVGGKCWMSFHGRDNASYIQRVNSAGLIRSDSDLVMPVDVIMAIKLMSPAAYNIDYAFDRNGEDFGWSRKAKEASRTLGWDGRICNRHVMRRDDLNAIDERCGF